MISSSVCICVWRHSHAAGPPARSRNPLGVLRGATPTPAVDDRKATGRPRWYLLEQINSLLEVHAEVNERPLNALALVLFLLEDEHVMVEELLQLLVGEVDAQLLEAVELLDRG